MYKAVLIEIIAPGKEGEDRAYRQKAQALFDEYGIAPTRVFRVWGRKRGQVFVELGEFETQEAAWAAWTQLGEDERWQALQEERIAAGTVVQGTDEMLDLRS
jgi:hypothetical protein